MADGEKIPQGRIRRAARLASVAGARGARHAGSRVAGAGRSEELARARRAELHAETAAQMAATLGQMKGVAMKLGQVASFIDTDHLPEEARSAWQEQLAALRTSAPPMPWREVEGVLRRELDGEDLGRLFADIEPEAFAAASIGQVHRAHLADGRVVAVKIQYPRMAEAVEADLRNTGLIVRLARALAPGLDAKAIAQELRERITEELDYELEAQSQGVFARAYRGHPFIHVPEVHSDLSRRRVLVSEYIEGLRFEAVEKLGAEERSRFGEVVFRGSFGSIYHLRRFNADPHPGNYLLMTDGRVAFLDFGMTKELTVKRIALEQKAIDAAVRDDADGLAETLGSLGFLRANRRIEAERLMAHVKAVGGWYMEDRELEVSPELVARIVESIHDPRSEFYGLMRRESVPAEELMGRRMELGVVAVLGRLRARRNWHRIAREWVYADEPSTELGKQEWAYFSERGVVRLPGLAG